jgi:TPR repeat protein
MLTSLMLAVLVAAPPCKAPVKDKLFDVGPCEGKPVEACIGAGDTLIASTGCRDEALARYDVGCKRGALRACSKLGFRLIEVTRDTAVVKRAITLFTKACDGNDALGCANLASLTWDGEGVTRDPKKAAVLSEKACTAGDAFSCGTLGSLWAQGELGAKDPAKAAKYFEQACQGGSASGCNQLGMALWTGAGVTKAPERAMDVWTTACADKNAAACANVGRALKERGDDARGRKAMSRACSLGDAEACKEKGFAGPDLAE